MLDELTPNNDDNTSGGDLPITGFSTQDFSRAPLVGAQQRLQSNAFAVSIAVNPLVAAASPLLAIATQLSELTAAPNLTQLHQDLSHEIKAFESKAHNLGYRAQLILAARYLLCATLDEIILNTPWGKDSEWRSQNLLITFQREPWGGDRFFLILERCSEDPALYLDILELGYLCLSLGFQGRYQGAQKMHGLAAFIDNLYDVIRHQRGTATRRLLTSAAPQQKHEYNRWRLPPLWLTAAATLAILAVIFIPYYIHLQTLTRNAQQTLQNLIKSQPQE